jgi:DNA-directed RNA polymerase specialized sigma24 family protein
VTVDDQQWLTERFQQHRPHLRAVAYRMLGSLTDADDAVQDAWERVSRARADEVGNLKAWLTTIVARQRAVVDAFLAASRAGDFDALVAVLHPDVVVRADFSPSRPRRSAVIRGAAAVARQALQGASPAAQAHPALVNGAAGAVLTMDGRPYAVFAFTIAEGKIVQIDAVADPDRVARLTAPVRGASHGS